MSTDDEAELRAELKAAIAAVRHQIEIQGMSDHYVGSGHITEDAIDELRAELAELETAYKDLGG
jgi:hypothetical protein